MENTKSKEEKLQNRKENVIRKERNKKRENMEEAKESIFKKPNLKIIPLRRNSGNW